MDLRKLCWAKMYFQFVLRSDKQYLEVPLKAKIFGGRTFLPFLSPISNQSIKERVLSLARMQYSNCNGEEVSQFLTKGRKAVKVWYSNLLNQPFSPIGRFEVSTQNSPYAYWRHSRVVPRRSVVLRLLDSLLLRLNELPSQIAPLRFSLVREEEKEQKRIKINQRLKPQTNNQTEKGTRGTGRMGEGREEGREGRSHPSHFAVKTRWRRQTQTDSSECN